MVACGTKKVVVQRVKGIRPVKKESGNRKNGNCKNEKETKRKRFIGGRLEKIVYNRDDGL